MKSLVLAVVLVVMSAFSNSEADQKFVRIEIAPATFPEGLSGVVLNYRTNFDSIEYRFTAFTPVHQPPRNPVPQVGLQIHQQFPAGARTVVQIPQLDQSFRATEIEETTSWFGYENVTRVNGAGATTIWFVYRSADLEKILAVGAERLMVVARAFQPNRGGIHTLDRAVYIKTILAAPLQATPNVRPKQPPAQQPNPNPIQKRRPKDAIATNLGG